MSFNKEANIYMSSFISLNSNGNGGAIFLNVSHTSIFLEFCFFHMCKTGISENYGGSVYFYSRGGSSTFSKCCFSESFASRYGFSLSSSLEDYSSNNQSILFSTSVGCYGHAINVHIKYGTVQISNYNGSNHVCELHADLYVYSADSQMISYSHFTNQTNDIILQTDAYGESLMHHSNIFSNYASKNNYGVIFTGGSPTLILNLSECVFYNNENYYFDAYNGLINIDKCIVDKLTIRSGSINTQSVMITSSVYYSVHQHLNSWNCLGNPQTSTIQSGIYYQLSIGLLLSLVME